MKFLLIENKSNKKEKERSNKVEDRICTKKEEQPRKNSSPNKTACDLAILPIIMS
jgi:uncharacterized protein YeaC (DUF1315 family)